MPNQKTSTARTIVITGGTSGIGFACAAAIMGSHDGPWHVVLPCRDAGRGKVAVDKLAGIAGAAGTAHTVEAMPLDLASLASVRDFAAALAGRVSSGEIPALHALVCNAGV
jgi:NAD(P)-dependent dehydrogenase (short-subunit alcohol dehydrogenase family)